MDRENIWHAMSNLYLDEEIDNIALLMVARELAKENIAIHELDKIFYEEVHPVLCWNFTVPAGAWGSFDKDHLSNLIIEYKESQSSDSLNWI